MSIEGGGKLDVIAGGRRKIYREKRMYQRARRGVLLCRRVL